MGDLQTDQARATVDAAFMSPGVFSRSINRPTVDAVIATQVQSTVVCCNATMEAQESRLTMQQLY